jgi:hypothetical protein
MVVTTPHPRLAVRRGCWRDLVRAEGLTWRERTVDTTDSKREQALAVFHHAAEEIRFFKKQQWLVTNYTVLTYTVLVAAPEAVGGSKDAANSFFVFANWAGVAGALVACIAAIWVLLSLDRSHQKELDRMNKARVGKLPVVQDIHGTRSNRPGRHVVLLGLVLLIGALLVLLINYSRVYPD